MEEYQLQINKNKEGKIEEIVFGEEMILTAMESLKEDLIAIDFSTSKKIKLNLEKVNEIDLAFLQLFRALLNSLENQQIDTEIEWPKNEELMGLLNKAGFSEVFKMKL